MLICRPTIPMGKDIGFLPGTVEEKLNPWMQPIFDALDLLSNGRRAGFKRSKSGPRNDRIGIEPLTYIRGRSIPNQYIVVDEAQNLTPLEAKTVLTRVGPGTKIVLTGDIYQIDNPYVDSMSNGLTYIVERFRSARHLRPHRAEQGRAFRGGGPRRQPAMIRRGGHPHDRHDHGPVAQARARPARRRSGRRRLGLDRGPLGGRPAADCTVAVLPARPAAGAAGRRLAAGATHRGPPAARARPRPARAGPGRLPGL
jgi:hypothetical protein